MLAANISIAVIIPGALRFCDKYLKICFPENAAYFDLYLYSHTSCQHTHLRIRRAHYMLLSEMEEEQTRTGGHKVLSQFYKLAKVWEIVQEYEQTRGRQYDYILKWRSDIICNSKFNALHGLSNLNSLPQQSVRGNSDLFFVGSRKTFAAFGKMDVGLLDMLQHANTHVFTTIDVASVQASGMCARIELLRWPMSVVEQIRTLPPVNREISSFCKATTNLQACLEKAWASCESKLCDKMGTSLQRHCKVGGCNTKPLMGFLQLRKVILLFLQKSSIAQITAEKHTQVTATWVTQVRGLIPVSAEGIFSTWLFHKNVSFHCFPGLQQHSRFMLAKDRKKRGALLGLRTANQHARSS